MLNRAMATFIGVLLCVGLASCFERFDDNVLFQNNTDQDLLVIGRNGKDTRSRPIPARTTTPVLLLPKDTCSSAWLIYDSTGTKVVKDPGEICWHQTVTIP